VAGAIAGQVRSQGQATAQAIGAQAVNQMVKATVLAGRVLGEEGPTLICVPSFAQTTVDGEERTAIRFAIRPTQFA
jgi:stage V sporulation protein S